jgi:F0F1-type ATP synthase delta subunit
MKGFKVAGRYAQSLLELAQETNAIDAVLKDMSALIDVANDMDKNCIDFAKWCFKTVKQSSNKYVFKYQNKVVADEFTLKELLHIWKEEKYNYLINK